MTSQSLNVLRAPRFRENRFVPLLFLVVELFAVELSLQIGIGLREAVTLVWPIDLSHHGPTEGLFLAFMILPLVYWMGGLNPGYGLNRFERLQRQAKLTVLVFFCFFVWDYLVLSHQWSRGVLLATMAWSLLLVPIFGELLRGALIRLGQWGTPTLIVGAGDRTRSVLHDLTEDPALGLVPVGILEDDESRCGYAIDGVPILGSSLVVAPNYQDLAQTAILVTSKKKGPLAEVLQHLPFRRVFVIHELQGLPTLWVTAHDLHGILMLEYKCNLRLRRNRILKRLIDAALAAFFLLLSAPVIAACALLIKRVSPGPAFYSQVREGLNGRRIRVHKLRTMHVDSEARLSALLKEDAEALREWSAFMKLKDDPRIIPGIGPFMRRYSIDELPQLWNVLCGQMSLVGPRPFPLYHLDCFDAAFRRLRCTVPPGVTGLWQISARSDGNLQVQQAMDTYYIRNWSPWMDADILLRTLNAVLIPRGAV